MYNRYVLTTLAFILRSLSIERNNLLQTRKQQILELIIDQFNKMNRGHLSLVTLQLIFGEISYMPIALEFIENRLNKIEELKEQYNSLTIRQSDTVSDEYLVYEENVFLRNAIQIPISMQMNNIEIEIYSRLHTSIATEPLIIIDRIITSINSLSNLLSNEPNVNLSFITAIEQILQITTRQRNQFRIGESITFDGFNSLERILQEQANNQIFNQLQIQEIEASYSNLQENSQEEKISRFINKYKEKIDTLDQKDLNDIKNCFGIIDSINTECKLFLSQIINSRDLYTNVFANHMIIYGADENYKSIVEIITRDFLPFLTFNDDTSSSEDNENIRKKNKKEFFLENDKYKYKLFYHAIQKELHNLNADCTLENYKNIYIKAIVDFEKYYSSLKENHKSFNEWRLNEKLQEKHIEEHINKYLSNSKNINNNGKETEDIFKKFINNTSVINLNSNILSLPNRSRSSSPDRSLSRNL